MKEEKIFRACKRCMMVLLTVIALVYLIYGGFIEGKAYCYLLSAMVFVLDAAWIYDGKKKLGDYGRE